MLLRSALTAAAVVAYGFAHPALAQDTIKIPGVLELSGAIDAVRLEERLEHLTRAHPILRARPGRSWNLMPRWKPMRAAHCRYWKALGA